MRLDYRIARYGIKLLSRYLDNYDKEQKKKKENEWFSLFIKSESIKFCLNDSLFIYLLKDSFLSRLIYSGFEESEILFLRRYLSNSDIFFDIGSNIGLYSLHAAQVVGKTGKVFAFEPTPSTYSQLKRNVDLNNFGKYVICNNIGLSDNKGTLKMNVSSNGYDAWNTFAKPIRPYFDKQIEIPVETFDNYINNNNINIKDISLIKVDVEGWETFVFKGASSLKDQDSPVLLVEFTEDYAFAAGSNCYELYDLIKSFGYDWFTYNSISNQLVPEPKRLHYPYNNLIAIKNKEKVQVRLSNKLF